MVQATSVHRSLSASYLLAISILLLIVAKCAYRLHFHPLARVSGPFLAKCKSLWQILHSYLGDECTAVKELHGRYGKVVRIGPNMVDISDGAALESIYVSKGGYSKPSWYYNAYVDGFSTIFSSTDLAYRATKARVVAPLFSNLAIYRDQKSLDQSVDHFVQALIRSKEASNGRHVDMQEHARALGLGVLSTYLFRHQPPRIQKLVNEGSMIPWLDFVVDIGQFFLPSIYAVPLLRFILVHEYTMNLPGGGENKTQSFQGRLLEQGFSKEEVAAECKSMMVAGIHSLGTVLSMIIYYLAKDEETYDRLRAEISNHGCSGVDIQRLPFLQGVIKEGFRLAPANATRFPRVVPSMGWQFNGYYFPPGTVVGIANPQLFSDPDVYNEPMAFRPERWLDPSAKMQRDLVPFGLGIRQCIAKNLATAALFMAVEKAVESDVLKGAKPVKDPIEFWEWFNVAAKGNKVELVWSSG